MDGYMKYLNNEVKRIMNLYQVEDDLETIDRIDFDMYGPNPDIDGEMKESVISTIANIMINGKSNVMLDWKYNQLKHTKVSKVTDDDLNILIAMALYKAWGKRS